MLPLTRNWESQPPEWQAVDPTHPLGGVLDALWVGTDLSGRDWIGGQRVPLRVGTTLANSARGRAFSDNGTTGSAQVVNGPSTFPYVQFGYGIFASSGGAWVLSNLASSAGGTVSRIALASATTIDLRLQYSFGTARTIAVTLATTVNVPICAIAVVISATEYYLYVNGRSASGTLTPGTLPALDRMAPPGDSTNGLLYATGFGSHAPISAEQALAITANPEHRLWSMFQRRIWIPVTAGAGGFTLTAASGSYTLTGQAAGLLAARTVVAEQGSYALTGQDATLTKSLLMLAEQGSYALSGQSAGLFASRQLLAEQGAYALSGQDATLTYTPAGAYTLTANSGSYALAGRDAALLLARTLVAAQGSYALTGQDATLSSGKILLAASGSYALTGQDAAFRRTYALAAGFGSYTLTGQVATLTYSAGIVAILEQVRLRSRITQAVSAPSRITQQLALRSQVRH